MDQVCVNDERSREAPAAAQPKTFSLRQRFALGLISLAGYLLVRLIGPTLRFAHVAEAGSFTGEGKMPSDIYCFWHRAVIASTWYFRRRQIAVMTSRSYDGEYIARIITRFGFRPVRGSSSRGAVGALIGMRKELDLGNPVAFTIDGPRGPIYVAKPGPVLLAKKTGHPILCFYVAVERAWIMKSWDRLVVPKPFSRAVVYFCSPIAVPPDADDARMEVLHRQMQETLERSRREAEACLQPGDHPAGPGRNPKHNTE